MKNNFNKKKFFVILGIIVLILIVAVTTLIYLNTNSNNYSFLERSWISDNSNNVIDISIESGLPIFSESGKGVFYDFLNDFEVDTGLTMNVVNTDTNYKMISKSEIDDNDIVIYEDHYVLVSLVNEPVYDISELTSQAIGVFTDDLSKVAYHMSDYTNVTYTSYASITEINNAMGDTLAYAIMPLYKYLNNIMNQQYNIVHHFDFIKTYYVLDMPNNNSKLNNIFTKFSNRWEEKKNSNINEHLVNLYYNSKSLTELQKEEIINDDYIVGFIKNLPFEGKINRNFNGITNEYLEGFEDLTGATFKYLEYSNVESLIKSLNDKKVDIALNVYGINNNNYVNSNTLGSVNYVVLAHKTNNLVVDSIKNLSGNTITMLDLFNLTTYMNEKNLTIDKVSSVEDLIDELNEDSIILIEKEVYDFYKTKELKDYSIRYMDKAPINNNFLLNNSNTVFGDLFNFYISVTSSENIKYKAINKSVDANSTNLVFNFILTNITYIIVLIAALIFFFYKFNKRVRVTKKIKKEDKLMYLDVMTNLKNRNYLNDNIEYWESNKVYPQAIITLDLKRIKELNDAYGHSEGDNQIKSAANILIKTQRENSEIIRTDGNEFMIYLVGYEEKMILTYMHKLNKEFEHLPHPYGVSIGYSMINDEIKTIDDAINEALIMMRKNKGQ